MFSTKIKWLIIIFKGPTYSTDMDVIKKWVRPAPCKRLAACFSHIPKWNCLSGLTLWEGSVISVLQRHKNICGNVVITWLGSTYISKLDCVITVLRDNCDVAREKCQWSWVLKIERGYFAFSFFPSCVCINLDLVQMLQEFQLVWKKISYSCCEINVSLPWLGCWEGWGDRDRLMCL